MKRTALIPALLIALAAQEASATAPLHVESAPQAVSAALSGDAIAVVRDIITSSRIPQATKDQILLLLDGAASALAAGDVTTASAYLQQASDLIAAQTSIPLPLRLRIAAALSQVIAELGAL